MKFMVLNDVILFSYVKGFKEWLDFLHGSIYIFSGGHVSTAKSIGVKFAAVFSTMERHNN